MRDQFVSTAVTFAMPHRVAPVECFLVRIHSTGATETVLDAFLARPSRDHVRYALIAASAFEDGPGLCTVTRREQYTAIETPELLAQIVGATNGILAEDSTYYEML